MSRFPARLAVGALLAIAAACDKVPLLAPTQSTITLSINTTTLPINGTAEVLATVTEQSGTPVHNGTTVTFTSSVGIVEPREARTEGGIARVTFRANGQSGTARVTAFSGAARSEIVEILVGGAAAQTVVVRLEPPSVPQTGGTVQVIAVVSDASGNRLPGAPVVFAADNGTIGSNTGITDANGEARTTLTTNRQTIVRATVASKEGQATVTVVNLPTVQISVSPATPLVGLPTVFTVTPGSATGGNPIQNVTLDFGDGKPPANLGAISGATPVSHVYDRADTYTATATVVDTSGQRQINSLIVVVQRPVINVALSHTPPTGQVGAPVTFTVAVTNSSNVPISAVTLNYGDGSPIVSLGPTGGTSSKIYLTSSTFTVTATAIDQSGNRYTATDQVPVAPPAAFNVTLDATSGDAAIPINCGGSGTSYPKTCTATFLGAGVRVIFTAGCNTGFGTGVCANATSYIWNFGDGGVETTTSNSTDHVFRTRNEFVITVTVQTSTGASGSQRLTLIIQ